MAERPVADGQLGESPGQGAGQGEVPFQQFLAEYGRVVLLFKLTGVIIIATVYTRAAYLLRRRAERTLRGIGPVSCDVGVSTRGRGALDSDGLLLSVCLSPLLTLYDRDLPHQQSDLLHHAGNLFLSGAVLA